MPKNRLIIAAAGSGKTTFLVEEALQKPKNDSVLITTYTEANEAEIRNKIIKKKKCIPSNITVQTWFSFLLQHGVKPYQGALNDLLWDNDIKGMLLTEGQSAKKMGRDGKQVIINGYPQYWGEENFQKHYFSTDWKIYSDKVSKFIFNCNKETRGEIILRISRIFPYIFIDEVQDLAGFDYEFIKSLFKTSSNILLVGDPRQVTYFTHPSRKHKQKYGNGRIKEFLQDNCKSLLSADSIDETTLKKSHRNNKQICDFSSKLYPQYEKTEPCECKDCHNEKIDHQGVFMVKPKDVRRYLATFKPIQLRWNKRIKTNPNYPTYNFGESKGQTHERVLIYPTKEMTDWILNNKSKLEDATRAKFYVALTRAKFSCAIVYDYTDSDNIFGVVKFKRSVVK